MGSRCRLVQGEVAVLWWSVHTRRVGRFRVLSLEVERWLERIYLSA